MPGSPLYEIRREAQDRGLRWPDVQDAYRHVKSIEWEKREQPNEVRQTAWALLNAHSPGCWPFWRHGFYARYGHKIARGADHTCVPGYDEISQEIGWQFPEYADDEGTERLWDFLFSPYDKLPTREEMYRDAMDLLEAWAQNTLTEVPF